MEAVKIRNLSFTYPNREKKALEGINLTINKGEFVVVCGRTGCGKSTLLKMLKPILSPKGVKEGTVNINGRCAEDMTVREQSTEIGFVMQDADSQLVCDKVWHELAFGLESLGCPAGEIRGRVAETACFFGIEELFYKDTSCLSGGEKQLVNLAAVMVMQPSVLILDEPASQLDPIAAHDFLQTLSRINKELGTTVIISEHRLEEVFALCDRVIVLEDGRVAAEGEPNFVGKMLMDIKSIMTEALPAASRIYYASGGRGKCPVTVREGREWLRMQNIKDGVSFEDKEEKNTDTALELNDVWFRYEKNLPDVLKGFNLRVRRNEFYALVGGNGAGKTTALSVIGKINRPYRGKVTVYDNMTVAALPQNPLTLFTRKTVIDDLTDAAEGMKITKEEKEERLSRVVELCNIRELLYSHPYDLSGGEVQRAALAMVLLRNPDILILDEPTKGLDAHFKKKTAQLIKALQQRGMTVIMVSHDIEFCAEYADRCGMLFDGQLVSEDTPRRFFSGKSFYTTAVNRIARNIADGAVTYSDILRAIGAEAAEENTGDAFAMHCAEGIEAEKTTALADEPKPKKWTVKNVVFGVFFLLAFFATQFLFCGRYDNWKEYICESASILFLTLACINLIPRGEVGVRRTAAAANVRITKRTAIAALITLLLIPFTIFIGKYYLGDRKYYFISILCILEIMVPFVLVFEGRKPRPRELVMISVLCAIGVASRIAFAPLPEFKPVTALVIIAGVCFGGETGFLVGAVTAFVSNFFFGQGPWTPWQMFAFGMIGFFAGVCFQKRFVRKTKTDLCIFGFLATVLLYGGIMNPASVIIWQAKPNMGMILSSYVMGLPFDLIHGLSTVFFLWLAAEPMCEKIERIKIKYGLIDKYD